MFINISLFFFFFCDFHFRWRGDHAGNTNKRFPANYVEIVDDKVQDEDDAAASETLLRLSDCHFGKFNQFMAHHVVSCCCCSISLEMSTVFFTANAVKVLKAQHCFRLGASCDNYLLLSLSLSDGKKAREEQCQFSWTPATAIHVMLTRLAMLLEIPKEG